MKQHRHPGGNPTDRHQGAGASLAEASQTDREMRISQNPQFIAFEELDGIRTRRESLESKLTEE